ncbi:hypothetical protein ACIQZB_44160 [Streptomyces sp. NPDC097727]|uniref:hypothetical protein n=1 Tax=Streptomyces sp. NPDC097727 TaxID=3366092 RepID=UPI0037F1DF4E
MLSVRAATIVSEEIAGAAGEIRQAVAALSPAVVQVADEVFRWKPSGHDGFEYYVRYLGNRACTTNFKVRNDLDRQLVLDFLTEIQPSQLAAVSEDKPIALFPGDAARAAGFDQVTVTHPSLLAGWLPE